MFEAYAAAKGDWVTNFTFTKALAPELPGEIKAQQAAIKEGIYLVLTSTNALSASLNQRLWIDLAPHKSALPNLESILQPQAFKMQALANKQGMVVTYYPSSPLIEYMPDAVPTPKSAPELLDWIMVHNNRSPILYRPIPALAVPSRCGLPRLLGDSDPRDLAKGWSKTSEYLAALGDNIEYYPTGTGQAIKELGGGTRNIVV
jgi:putative spermidine/putrescine transport system substrate-binding protein